MEEEVGIALAANVLVRRNRKVHFRLVGGHLWGWKSPENRLLQWLMLMAFTLLPSAL